EAATERMARPEVPGVASSAPSATQPAPHEAATATLERPETETPPAAAPERPPRVVWNRPAPGVTPRPEGAPPAGEAPPPPGSPRPRGGLRPGCPVAGEPGASSRGLGDPPVGLFAGNGAGGPAESAGESPSVPVRGPRRAGDPFPGGELRCGHREPYALPRAG